MKEGLKLEAELERFLQLRLVPHRRATYLEDHVMAEDFIILGHPIQLGYLSWKGEEGTGMICSKHLKTATKSQGEALFCVLSRDCETLDQKVKMFTYLVRGVLKASRLIKDRGLQSSCVILFVDDTGFSLVSSEKFLQRQGVC